MATSPPTRQREQGNDAPFTTVVGLQDENAVLDRDHDDEGPEDQGEDAQHRLGGQIAVACCVRGLLERIKGAGSDVAEHNPECAEDGRSSVVIGLGAVERNAGSSGHGGPPDPALLWIAGCLGETDGLAPVPPVSGCTSRAPWSAPMEAQSCGCPTALAQKLARAR